MTRIIYKVTNKVNNKVYIGKTIRPMKDRFNRHIQDANKNKNTNLKFHRAILKYGPQNFVVEKIDEANSDQELDNKEKFWINRYDSVRLGYNMTAGGEGGNTYQDIPKDRMNEIKHKISITKLGKKNKMSKQIKAFNIKTQKEYHFDTLTECLDFLCVRNKGTVTNRASGKVNTLWRNEWKFAYEGHEYGSFVEGVFDPSRRKGRHVFLIKDGKKNFFYSVKKACDFLSIPKTRLINGMIVKGYEVHFPESVSTIPDECKGVDLEISTESKRKTEKSEDIVSSNSNIG